MTLPLKIFLHKHYVTFSKLIIMEIYIIHLLGPCLEIKDVRMKIMRVNEDIFNPSTFSSSLKWDLPEQPYNLRPFPSLVSLHHSMFEVDHIQNEPLIYLHNTTDVENSSFACTIFLNPLTLAIL